MKLAIIGTAGRATDGKILASRPDLYLDTMKRAALKVADLTNSTTLLSGGAAWSDHIAILLFLDNPSRFRLQLELPAPLVTDGDGKSFDDNGTGNFKNNPGAVSNHYHRLFKKALIKLQPNWSPFIDFKRIYDYAEYSSRVTYGFLNRNLIVAREANHCIAMTFGNGAQLKDGGTAHTMSHFLARENHGKAYHLDLNTLKLYEDAKT